MQETSSEKLTHLISQFEYQTNSYAALTAAPPVLGHRSVPPLRLQSEHNPLASKVRNVLPVHGPIRALPFSINKEPTIISAMELQNEINLVVASAEMVARTASLIAERTSRATSRATSPTFASSPPRVLQQSVVAGLTDLEYNQMQQRGASSLAHLSINPGHAPMRINLQQVSNENPHEPIQNFNQEHHHYNHDFERNGNDDIINGAISSGSTRDAVARTARKIKEYEESVRVRHRRKTKSLMSTTFGAFRAIWIERPRPLVSRNDWVTSMAYFSLLKWVRLSLSVHRESHAPIWQQLEKARLVSGLSVEDRMHRGISAAIGGGGRRLSAVDASLHRVLQVGEENMRDLVTGRKLTAIAVASSSRSSRSNSISSIHASSASGGAWAAPRMPESSRSTTRRASTGILSTTRGSSSSSSQAAFAAMEERLKHAEEICASRRGRANSLQIGIFRSLLFTSGNEAIGRILLKSFFFGWKNVITKIKSLRKRAIKSRVRERLKSWWRFMRMKHTLNARCKVAEALVAKFRAADALTRWKGALLIRRRENTLLRITNGLVHLENAAVLIAIRRLRGAVLEWRRTSKVLTLMLQVMRSHLESIEKRAFMEWRNRCKKWVTKKTKAAANSGTMKRFLMRRCLIQWNSDVIQKKKKNALLRKAVNHMRSRAVFRTFTAWAEYAKRRVLVHSILKTAPLSIVRVKSRFALSQWRKSAKESNRMANLANKALAFWRGDTLRLVFFSWKSRSNNWRKWRIKCTEAITRIDQVLLLIHTKRWMAATAYNTKLRKTLDLLVGKSEERLTRDVTRAWHKWAARRALVIMKSVNAALVLKAKKKRAAVYAWFETTKREMRASSLRLKVIQRIANAKVAAAFHSLALYAQYKRSKKIKQDSNRYHILAFLARRIITSWKHRSKTTRRFKILERLALSHSSSFLLSSVFKGWCTVIMTRKSRNAIIRQQTQQFLLGRTPLYLEIWKAHAKSKALMTMVVKRLQQLAKFRAIECWHRKTREHILLRITAANFFNARVARGVRGWREAASEKRRERALLLGAIKRFEGGKLLQAVLMWQASTEGAILIRAAHVHLCRTRIGKAFRTWVLYLNARRNWREKGYSVRGAMLLYRAKKVTKTWLQIAGRKKATRNLMRKAVLSILMRNVAMAFSSLSAHRESRQSWKLFCVKQQRVLLSNNLKRTVCAWREARSLGKRFRQCIMMIKNRTLSVAFRTWSSYYASKLRWKEYKEEKMEEFLAFQGKHAIANWRKSMKVSNFGRKIFLGWQQREMVAAFRTWNAYTASRTEWKSFVAEKNDLLRRKRLSSALIVWRNRRKVSDFGRKIFLGWQQREMVAAFRTWNAYTASRTEWKSFVAEKNDLLRRKRLSSALIVWRNRRKVSDFGRKIFLGWQQREMVAAFRTWNAYTASRTEWKSFVAEKNDLLRRKRLSSALIVWRNRRKVSDFGRKIFLGWQQREMVAAFRTWNAYTASRTEWKSFVAEKNDLLRRKRLSSALIVWRNRRKVSDFGRKIFLGWQQREMVAAFRTWNAYTASRTEWKSFVAEKNDLLRRKRLSSALIVWRNRRKVSDFGRKIFLGWQQREMVAAFRTWNAYTASRTEWKSFVAEKNDLLRRKRLSSALIVWRNRRKVSDFGRKIFLGWQQREMVAAFRTWNAYINSKAEWRSFVAKNETSILTSRARNCLLRWSGCLRENKSMRVIIRNMSNSKTGAALRRWKECVEERRKNRDRLKQAFGYMKNGLLAKSFRSLKMYASRSKSLKAHSLAVAAILAVNRRRTAFVLWTECLQEEIRSRTADARFRSCASRHCIKNWLRWRKERAKSRKAIKDSLNVIARAKVRAIFMTWSFWSMKAKLLRAQVEHMVKTREKTEQIAALRIWRDCAHIRRVNRSVVMDALERMSTLRLRSLTNHWLAVSRAAQTTRAERLETFRIQMQHKRKAAVFEHMRLHYVLLRARKMAVATILSRHCFRLWFRESVLSAQRIHALGTILENVLTSRMMRGVEAFKAKVAAEKERRQNNSRLQMAALILHLGAARRSITAWRHETAVTRLTRNNTLGGTRIAQRTKLLPPSRPSSSTLEQASSKRKRPTSTK
jgi:hypothetical protein